MKLEIINLFFLQREETDTENGNINLLDFPISKKKKKIQFFVPNLCSTFISLRTQFQTNFKLLGLERAPQTSNSCSYYDLTTSTAKLAN